VTILELYDAHLVAYNACIEACDQLKTLKAFGERAAEATKNNTVGSTPEKIAAIQASWKVFNEAIAKAEKAVEHLRVTVDEAWNAYDDARIAQ
jgi:flagellar biosynthesis chaperone FliJ